MEQKINFGLKIKQLLQRNNQTLEEAAKLLGTTKATVSRWTNQEDNNTETLWNICQKYGVSMSYFLSQSGTYIQSGNTINGGINAVGEKIMQTGTVSDFKAQETILLAEKLRSCEEKNVLLERMVSILEKKG